MNNSFKFLTKAIELLFQKRRLWKHSTGKRNQAHSIWAWNLVMTLWWKEKSFHLLKLEDDLKDFADENNVPIPW